MPKVSALQSTPALASGDLVYVVADGVSSKLASLRVANIAALKAIAAPVDGMSVEVTEEWRGGLFVFDDTAGDDNGGTAFAPSDATIGLWHRRFSGPLDVRWFGAKGDYSHASAGGLGLQSDGTAATDDTAAIQAAIDAAFRDFTLSSLNYEDEVERQVVIIPNDMRCYVTGKLRFYRAPPTYKGYINVDFQNKGSIFVPYSFTGVLLDFVYGGADVATYNTAGTTLSADAALDVEQRGFHRRHDYGSISRIRHDTQPVVWHNSVTARVFDDGTWGKSLNDVSMAVRINNMWDSEQRFDTINGFDIAIGILGSSKNGNQFGMETGNVFPGRFLNNQIDILFHRLGPSYCHDLKFYGGNSRCDGNVTNVNNISKYAVVFDEIRSSGNVWFGLDCEHSHPASASTQGESLMALMIGEVINNVFFLYRNERLSRAARLEMGTPVGIDVYGNPDQNVFLPAFDDVSKIPGIIDNGKSGRNFVKTRHSAITDVASRFCMPLIPDPNLYNQAIRDTSNATRFSHFHIGKSGATTDSVDQQSTVITINNAQRFVTVQSSTGTMDAPGVRLENLIGREEFLCVASSPTGKFGYVGLRLFNSAGTMLTDPDLIQSAPAGDFQFFWDTAHNIFRTPTGAAEEASKYAGVRFKLNSATIAYIDVYCYGHTVLSEFEAEVSAFQIYGRLDTPQPLVRNASNNYNPLPVYAASAPGAFTKTPEDGQIVFKRGGSIDGSGRLMLGWRWNSGTSAWNELWVSVATWA